jgi:hypothetical protein
MCRRLNEMLHSPSAEPPPPSSRLCSTIVVAFCHYPFLCCDHFQRLPSARGDEQVDSPSPCVVLNEVRLRSSVVHRGRDRLSLWKRIGSECGGDGGISHSAMRCRSHPSPYLPCLPCWTLFPNDCNSSTSWVTLALGKSEFVQRCRTTVALSAASDDQRSLETRAGN